MSELDWRTVRELKAIRARLKELMEAAILPQPHAGAQASPAFECPIDVWENDTELVVEVELPGATPESIDVRLEGDRLVLSGDLPAAVDEAGSALRIERFRGPFRRTVTLPVEVEGAPAARLRLGVLEVRMPKKAPRKRRIIVDEGGA